MRPIVLLVVAAVLGSSVAQSGSEQQVRLEDIERENTKPPSQIQPQRAAASPYQGAYQPAYQHAPQYYQAPSPVQSAPPTGGAAQLFAQPSLNSGQLSAYHQQLFFSHPQQPILIPQHSTLPFPVMLIPSSYLLPQDVNSLLYATLNQGLVSQQHKYVPPQAQQIQPAPLKGFRPSPQINLPGQYSAPSQSYQPHQQQSQQDAYQSLYQQKFVSGVKSTATPPLKDNYVG